MANRQSYTARELTGHNVYHLHEKNQTVYYDTYTKTGYIITNQYVSKFSTWQTRLPLCIVLSSILVLAKLNFWLSIGIGVIAYVVSTILFHKSFLTKLPIKSNFERPASKGFFREIASQYPKRVLGIIVIMFVSMALVMIINAIVNKIQGPEATISYVFIVVSLIAALVVSYIYYLKGKENL